MRDYGFVVWIGRRDVNNGGINVYICNIEAFKSYSPWQTEHNENRYLFHVRDNVEPYHNFEKEIHSNRKKKN